MCEPDPAPTVEKRLKEQVTSLIQLIDANERYILDLDRHAYDLLELKDENAKHIEAIKMKYNLWKILKEMNSF